MLFGTTGTATALGPEAATPWGIGTVRIVIGAAALWALARTWPRIAPLRRQQRTVLLLGGIGVAAYQPGFFLGTERLGVALGTMIALTTGPIAAGCIDGVLSRRLPPRSWVTGTIVMIGGVILLLWGRPDIAGVALDPVGVMGSAIAGLGYAVYAVMARQAVLSGVESTTALAWEHTVGAVLLVPALVMVPLGWAADLDGIAMLLHLGVLTVGVAYLLYGIGLRTLDSSTAVSITLVEPLTATLLAVTVLDEALNTRGWVGAVIVLIGLGVIGRNARAATA
jgi:DME family drug/metabolite transporter